MTYCDEIRHQFHWSRIMCTHFFHVVYFAIHSISSLWFVVLNLQSSIIWLVSKISNQLSNSSFCLNSHWEELCVNQKYKFISLISSKISFTIYIYLTCSYNINPDHDRVKLYTVQDLIFTFSHNINPTDYDRVKLYTVQDLFYFQLQHQSY